MEKAVFGRANASNAIECSTFACGIAAETPRMVKGMKVQMGAYGTNEWTIGKMNKRNEHSLREKKINPKN